MQGNLGRFREGAHAEQQAGHDECRAVVAEDVRGRVEDPQVLNRVGVLEEDERAQHQPHVAHDVDHEGLDPGASGGSPAVPERDQGIGREADKGPADDQDDEVAGEDQQQHREHEEVQI